MSFFVTTISALPYIILPAKSLVKIDKNTIEADDHNTYGIDKEYILDSSTYVKSKLQVNKGNDNSEMEQI